MLIQQKIVPKILELIINVELELQKIFLLIKRLVERELYLIVEKNTMHVEDIH